MNKYWLYLELYRGDDMEETCAGDFLAKSWENAKKRLALHARQKRKYIEKKKAEGYRDYRWMVIDFDEPLVAVCDDAGVCEY